MIRTGLLNNLAVVLLVVCSTVIAFAAPPKTISYQGYLKDGTGVPVTSATNITFKLYSSTRAESGALWNESKSVTPANGVYSVVLGTGTPLDPLPFDVQYFLGVTVGGGSELTPRQSLSYSPYAFRALQSDNVSTASQIVSTVPTGTPPLQVSSTTLVPNLNADMVDGKHAAEFVLKAGDTMTGSLNLTANGLVVGTDQLVVSGGKMGIGTTSPSDLLEVSGNSEPFIRITNTGMSGNPFLLLGMNAGNNAALFEATPGKDFKFYNGQYVLTLRGGNGNVGIGTTNPTNAKLEVNGAIRSLTAPYGNMWGGGLILADEATKKDWSVHSHEDKLRMFDGVNESIVGEQASSLRLKKNISPLMNALGKIIKMNAVSFDFVPEIYSGKHSIGFIAEEMAEIVPEVVAKDQEGRPLSIDYGLLSTIALQGIKELQEKMAVIESAGIMKNSMDTGNNGSGYANQERGYIPPDTSALLVSMVKAMQEQQAVIDELKDEVTELKLMLRKWKQGGMP
jgi:hypothetical protein